MLVTLRYEISGREPRSRGSRSAELSRLGRRLDEFSEIIRRESCVTGDSTHRERVDGVVARNGDDSGAVGHDDVLALARDSKTDLLECTYRIEMIDAGDPGHD